MISAYPSVDDGTGSTNAQLKTLSPEETGRYIPVPSRSLTTCTARPRSRSKMVL